ncbi:MAG: aminoglycoside phosphotransferase family protein [Armatimonadetes bacterium]|nr:aminoglycoside phosphotransferase family protein [Armatimonadota bacterium]
MLCRVEELAGGLDRNAKTLRANCEQGVFVVKLRSEVADGWDIARRLADSGITEVVAPVRTKNGHLSAETKSGCLAVFPFVDGKNGFESEFTAETWRKIGDIVRRIKSVEMPGEKEDVKDFMPHVGSAPILEQIVAWQRAGTEQEVCSVLREHFQTIQSLVLLEMKLTVNRIKFAGKRVPSHTDLHHGNILVEGKGGVHIIDWDDAKLAPKECDLMFFLGGGIFRLDSDVERHFRAGYGDLVIDDEMLQYYRVCRALEEIKAFAIEASEEGGLSEFDRAESLRYLKGQFEKGYIVDLALG